MTYNIWPRRPLGKMTGFFLRRTQCCVLMAIGFAGALEGLAMDFVGSVNNFSLVRDVDDFAFDRVEFHLPVLLPLL